MADPQPPAVGSRTLAEEAHRRKGPRHRLAPHDEVENHRHGHECGPGEQRGSEERQSHGRGADS